MVCMWEEDRTVAGMCGFLQFIPAVVPCLPILSSLASLAESFGMTKPFHNVIRSTRKRVQHLTANRRVEYASCTVQKTTTTAAPVKRKLMNP